MRGSELMLAVLLLTIFGCGLRQALEGDSYGIPGVDFGPRPTDYESTVDVHLQHTFDQEPIGNGWMKWMGPFEGSIQRVCNGVFETVFGWAVHVWYDNSEIHYMVLIRDGKIVSSDNCGILSEGFGLLDFRRPNCQTGGRLLIPPSVRQRSGGLNRKGRLSGRPFCLLNEHPSPIPYTPTPTPCTAPTPYSTPALLISI